MKCEECALLFFSYYYFVPFHFFTEKHRFYAAFQRLSIVRLLRGKTQHKTQPASAVCLRDKLSCYMFGERNDEIWSAFWICAKATRREEGFLSPSYIHSTSFPNSIFLSSTTHPEWARREKKYLKWSLNLTFLLFSRNIYSSAKRTVMLSEFVSLHHLHILYEANRSFAVSQRSLSLCCVLVVERWDGIFSLVLSLTLLAVIFAENDSLKIEDIININCFLPMLCYVENSIRARRDRTTFDVCRDERQQRRRRFAQCQTNWTRWWGVKLKTCRELLSWTSSDMAFTSWCLYTQKSGKKCGIYGNNKMRWWYDIVCGWARNTTNYNDDKKKRSWLYSFFYLWWRWKTYHTSQSLAEECSSCLSCCFAREREMPKSLCARFEWMNRVGTSCCTDTAHPPLTLTPERARVSETLHHLQQRSSCVHHMTRHHQVRARRRRLTKTHQKW